jgi:hypothetical protein
MILRNFLIWSLLLCLLTLVTNAQSINATAKLVFDKPSYYLGENVIAHYSLTNTGNVPIKLLLSNLYHYPSPEINLIVFDSANNKVKKLYSPVGSYNIRAYDVSIAPGKTFWQSIPIMTYADITKAGTYTVKINREINLNTGNKTYHSPTATGIIKLIMPLKKEAEKILIETLSLPPLEIDGSGERQKNYADFTTFRFPIYLSLLKKLITKGNLQVFESLQYMRIPSATRIILAKCNNSNHNIMIEAQKTLITSLPPDSKTDKWSGSIINKDKAWTPKLKLQAKALAWKLLESSNREMIIDGAKIIQTIGSSKDLQRYITVFNRIIIKMKNNPLEQNKNNQPETACYTLMQTGRMLLLRGAKPPKNIKSTATRLLSLYAIQDNKPYRPKKWEKNALILLRNHIPFVQTTVLENLHYDISDKALLEEVRKRIRNSNPDIQSCALEIAINQKNKLFSPDSLYVLEYSNDKFITEQAFDATIASGISRDKALETVISRPYNSKLTSYLFNRIIINNLVFLEGGSTSKELSSTNAIRLKSIWLKFINDSREDIRKGKRFKVPNPPLTPEMFLPIHQFDLPNGKYWPETPATK